MVQNMVQLAKSKSDWKPAMDNFADKSGLC